MKNKKWKNFGKLTEMCYLNMLGVEENGNCWDLAFDLLKEIVQEERKTNPAYASQLEMLDEETDFEYDIQGWVEDCLDEFDMREDYDLLLRRCDDLLNLFGWPECSGSDIKFMRASALMSMGRQKEAAAYCRKWIQREPENIMAAAAGVYAFIGTGEYEEAEKQIDRFIFDRTDCNGENDIMFTAASKLYEATGDKRAKKQIDRSIQKYEKLLEEYMESLESEDDLLDFFDGNLPF